MRWHCVKLTSADVSRGWHSTILAQFETFFVAMGSPSGMAMLATSFSGAAACIYFSPATALHSPGFLTLVTAMACDAPSEPVVLLAGDPMYRNEMPPRD